MTTADEIKKPLDTVKEVLEFIANGCLVPPDGGEPCMQDAMIEAKRGLKALISLSKSGSDVPTVTVPREPTPSMLAAGQIHGWVTYPVKAIYEAMIYSRPPLDSGSDVAENKPTSDVAAGEL